MCLKAIQCTCVIKLWLPVNLEILLDHMVHRRPVIKFKKINTQKIFIYKTTFSLFLRSYPFSFITDIATLTPISNFSDNTHAAFRAIVTIIPLVTRDARRSSVSSIDRLSSQYNHIMSGYKLPDKKKSSKIYSKIKP